MAPACTAEARSHQRRPRSVRGKPAPARLPAAGWYRTAEGEPGRGAADAGQLARDRRRWWRAARSDVWLRHTADRRGSDGDGYRAEYRPYLLGFPTLAWPCRQRLAVGAGRCRAAPHTGTCATVAGDARL